MSLPFFYEPDIAHISSQYTLSEESSKHCIQVLRMQSGDALQLTNGKGTCYTAQIISADKKQTVVSIESTQEFPPPPYRIGIAVSLLKNASRLEWLLEKITEMGIHEIFPMICARTEHERFRFVRMQQIIISAMLQSQQAWLPILHEPQSFDTIIQQNKYTQLLLAHCEVSEKTPVSLILPNQSTLLFIGPEGDFTPDEIQQGLNNHCIPVSLGTTRLRTETAGMVGAAILINNAKTVC